jgi:heavy metal sensor kinase
MIDSIRTRLTLWYVVVLAAVLVAFSAATYGLLSRGLHERLDETLAALVDVAVVSLTHDADEGQSVADAAESTVRELSNQLQAVAIYSADLSPLAVRQVEDDIVPRLPGLSDIPEDYPYFFTAEEEGDDDRVRVGVRRVAIAPLRRYVVAVSQSLDSVEDELESLRRIFLWTIPMGLVLAAVGGSLLARRTLSPVMSMAAQARSISAELDRRLPVSNPRDELGRLALTFNELLDRLAEAFIQQRQFMADTSHELRTPLSAIRTAASVTLRHETRDEQEYRQALQVVDEQSRRLSRIVEDMFTLARVDAGHAPLQKRQFYLDELLAEITRAASVIGTRRSVTVSLHTPGESALIGDEELVRRMLTNLIDNAVRYAPEQTDVRVDLSCDQEHCEIRVADKGPGIPAEDQQHIFDRFYRADKSRSRSQSTSGGSGLGLAIARWIAEAHGGTLVLEHSDPTGSIFRVSLPRT